MTSAPPATARNASASHEVGHPPARTRRSPTPHTRDRDEDRETLAADPRRPTPTRARRRARPNATALNSQPTASGPPWNCSSASTGNSTRGMPNTIATMSTVNVDCRTRLPLQVAQPVLHRRPARVPSSSRRRGCGRCGRSMNANAERDHVASRRRCRTPTPARGCATTIPPSAGPTITGAVPHHLVERGGRRQERRPARGWASSRRGSASRSTGTRRSARPRRRGARAAGPRARAPTSRSVDAPISPDCASSRMRRRSRRSICGPEADRHDDHRHELHEADRADRRRRVRSARTTCTNSATIVIWLPICEMSSPHQSSRKSRDSRSGGRRRRAATGPRPTASGSRAVTGRGTVPTAGAVPNPDHATRLFRGRRT